MREVRGHGQIVSSDVARFTAGIVVVDRARGVDMEPMLGFDASKCDPDHDICEWTYDLTSNQTVANVADVLIGKPLAIVGLLLLMWVLRWILHRFVDRLVSRAEDGVLPDRMSRFGVRGRAAAQATARDLATQTRRVQRAKTMGDLLKSVITGLLIAVFGTMILSELGVNIAPIIASAGIIGIALGFGAQSLVKDFLSGVFMIFEDQYGVGDVVDIGEASGTVEAVSLRVTRLRDLDGTVWYVPNGEILRVGNMSQNWSRAVVDVSVGYGEDLVRVKEVLREIAHDLWRDEGPDGFAAAFLDARGLAWAADLLSDFPGAATPAPITPQQKELPL